MRRGRASGQTIEFLAGAVFAELGGLGGFLRRDERIEELALDFLWYAPLYVLRDTVVTARNERSGIRIVVGLDEDDHAFIHEGFVLRLGLHLRSRDDFDLTVLDRGRSGCRDVGFGLGAGEIFGADLGAIAKSRVVG